MVQYIEKSTGDPVTITTFWIGDRVVARVQKDGEPERVIAAESIDHFYDIVTPQTIELTGEGKIGAGGGS